MVPGVMRPIQLPIEQLQPGDTIAVPKHMPGLAQRPTIEFYRFEDVLGYDRLREGFYCVGVRLFADGADEEGSTFLLDVRYAVWVVDRAV